MPLCMRTTIDINDELLALARQRANEERTSVRAIIERALRSSLMTQPTTTAYRLRWRTEHGRLRPGVDLTDRDALMDLMDGA